MTYYAPEWFYVAMTVFLFAILVLLAYGARRI